MLRNPVPPSSPVLRREISALDRNVAVACSDAMRVVSLELDTLRTYRTGQFLSLQDMILFAFLGLLVQFGHLRQFRAFFSGSAAANFFNSLPDCERAFRLCFSL